jgi:hypothetical protein
VLAAAAALVPLEQARIHTATSLDKHVDVGAWFASIAAGFLLAKSSGFFRRVSARRATVFASIFIVIGAAIVDAAQVGSLYDWANATRFVNALRPLALHSSGPMLVEDPSPARYYLGSQVLWQRWSSTFSVLLPSDKNSRGIVTVATAGRPALYVQLISRGFFTLVALDFHSGDLDRQIINAMSHHHAYHFVTEVQYGAGRYEIWERRH